MRDDFTYDPAEIEVTAGETIAFNVVNEGELTHEFVIGTERQHDDHEREMAKGGEHAEHESELKGVSVAPGKRKTFTFAVPAEGTLSFGCHERGHYEKGMKGSFRYLQTPRR